MADKIAKVQQETFNPFTPEFGKVPAYFAGREQVLSDILSAFEKQTMNLCAYLLVRVDVAKRRSLPISATRRLGSDG